LEVGGFNGLQILKLFNCGRSDGGVGREGEGRALLGGERLWYYNGVKVNTSISKTVLLLTIVLKQSNIHSISKARPVSVRYHLSRRTVRVV
jgi:hypothetical protein